MNQTYIIAMLAVTLVSFLSFAYLLLPFSLFSSEEPDKLFYSPHLKIRPNASIPISTRPDFNPPLQTSGRNIIDSNGKVVRLRSINWYGASDIDHIPSGLDIRHRDNISTLIRQMGFNSVRFPYSDEMVRTNPSIAHEKLAANPDLIGMSALEVFHAVVKSMTDHGLFVIPNSHITQARWCCDGNLCDAAWSNDYLGPICRFPQTEEQWMGAWELMMRPLARNRLVIGADLRNEVRGLWGTMSWETWATAAEKCSERLLDINSEWLMIIEGVSSANDLSGVKERPIELSIDNKVVYSAHVYSWSGWGEFTPYSKASYEHFAKAMRKNWAYLLEEDIAPVWIGEFGTSDTPTKGDRNYWTHLMQFLKETDADFGYWALNPRKPFKNEHESYGLVDDDWERINWDYRLQDLSTLGLKTGDLIRSV